MLSRREARSSRSSNSVLSRSCGGTNSQSRNLRRPATLRSRVRSKAGFISTITPCELQRATAMGACSKAARKVRFSPAGGSDHGNGVAVFIQATVARDDSRKEAHDWLPVTSVFLKWEQGVGAKVRLPTSR